MRCVKSLLIGIIAICPMLNNGFSATMNNPMTEDLDGGGYNLGNISDIITKGPWVDARIYNSGVFNDTTITSALNSIGTSKKTLLLASGTWQILNSIIIPSNVNLRFEHGAVLDISAGVTVTINGLIEARISQIFSGSGIVSFGSNYCYVKEFYPQWWGAKGDNLSDDTSSINAAIRSAGIGTTIVVPPGFYKVSSLNFTRKDSVVFYAYGARFIPTSNKYPVFDLTGAIRLVFKGVYINGSGSGIVPPTAIFMARDTVVGGGGWHVFERLRIDGKYSPAVLYMYGATLNLFESCEIYQEHVNPKSIIWMSNLNDHNVPSQYNPDITTASQCNDTNMFLRCSLAYSGTGAGGKDCKGIVFVKNGGNHIFESITTAAADNMTAHFYFDDCGSILLNMIGWEPSGNGAADYLVYAPGAGSGLQVHGAYMPSSGSKKGAIRYNAGELSYANITGNIGAGSVSQTDPATFYFYSLANSVVDLNNKTFILGGSSHDNVLLGFDWTKCKQWYTTGEGNDGKNNTGAEEYGTTTFSGDGSTTIFNITLNFWDTPRWYYITPKTTDATGDFSVSTPAPKTLRVTYKKAPQAGTENVVLQWRVGI